MIVGLEDAPLPLFDSIHSYEFFRQKELEMQDEIDYVLTQEKPMIDTNSIDKIKDKYRLTLPVLGTPRIVTHQPINYTGEDLISNPQQYFYGPRAVLVLEIPFTGSYELFNVNPSQHGGSGSKPSANVHEDLITLTIHSQSGNDQEFEQKIKSEQFKIDQYLAWLKPEIDIYNQRILQIIKQKATEHSHAADRLSSLAKSLNMEIKQSSNHGDISENEIRKETLFSSNKLRKLIDLLLSTDADFSAFVSDYFREIQLQYGDSMDRKKRVTILFEKIKADKILAALKEAYSDDFEECLIRVGLR